MPINHPFTLLVTAASDPSVTCERLLRAALVVAKAMDDQDFAAWCQAELNGYFNTKVTDLPDYRWVVGVVMVKDEWGRVTPALFGGSKDQEQLSRSQIAEPLGQVERNANMPRETEFFVHYPTELGAQLRKAFNGATDVFRVVARLGFENVVTHVRQRAFMWAVEGINREVPHGLGDTTAVLLGITHAQPQRHTPVPAHAETLAAGTINFNNSNLLLNSPGASPSVVHHQGVDREALVLLVAELRQAMEAVVEANRPADLVAALVELEGLAAMPAPRSSFVSEALSSLRAVIEGGAGAVLGEVSKPHVLTMIANVFKG